MLWWSLWRGWSSGCGGRPGSELLLGLAITAGLFAVTRLGALARASATDAVTGLMVIPVLLIDARVRLAAGKTRRCSWSTSTSSMWSTSRSAAREPTG